MNRMPAFRLAACALVAALAACSGDQNPVRDLVVGVGAGPTSAPTPDFVQRSRPARLDYVPIGTAAPARSEKARTAEEVKAAEAEMDAVRAANEAAAQAAAAEAAATTPAAPVAPPR
jgi:hypothetical protein